MVKDTIASVAFFIGAAFCFALVGILAIVDAFTMKGEWKND